MSPVNPRQPTRSTKLNRKFSNNVPPGLHYLPPLDPRSEEFVELFRSFLSSKDERTNILALAEPDARLFIELIDRALRASPLDSELHQLAFSILRKLSNRTGHLPESYLLSDKFDVSGKIIASGGFADVRMGVFKGRNVAVKTLRVSVSDDKAKIRRHFCKEVSTWKNLSHPNVLGLIGVPDTLEEGMFSMVSEWMVNGNIMQYVRNNDGNHLQLLAGAVEGLRFLHNANIVHGDLKGANILITNTTPVLACLADFGFMTIVHNPDLEMVSPKSAVAGGTTTFMAPELLVPSGFGLDKCAPTKGADVYAMGMVIYQVLTGSLPYGKLGVSEVILKVLVGEKPTKPANAIELGLSDNVWKLLEDCWKHDCAYRPSVEDVSACINSAASTCGILSPTGNTPQRHEDPDSGLSKFDFSNNVPPGLHYLPSLDPRSEEFVELFRSFLSSKDERTNILALAESDARLFIELIDRALRASPLDNELRQLAFSILRKVSGRIGHLPESYLLSRKLDISGKIIASGGFADVRMGVFRGKDVAVKTLRVSPSDDKAKIRRHFCKEVSMWKNLSHPNVLGLIGVPDTLEGGRFSVVSEWMVNGNIMQYVRNNAGNHLRLLAGAVEGLRYLHNASIVHGDLKGANILITNTNPVSACLADFGFMTIVYNPGLEMESSKSTVAGGTTPFMAPELLVPSRFGLDKCALTKGADVYAMAMTIYQVLTGSLPYGKLSDSEVIFKVLGEGKPAKPANAIELGLSDKVWRLLEDCWETDCASRPSVTDVLTCIQSAASTCGMLSPVGGTPQRHEDPDSDLFKFDHLFEAGDGFSAASTGRTPSEGSILTDTSFPDSLFSKASETASYVTDSSRISIGAWVAESKDESTGSTL